MNIWEKVFGVITPGGDTCWKCPICGKGIHVMGIETIKNHTNICKDCGAIIYYPWEKEKVNNDGNH